MSVRVDVGMHLRMLAALTATLAMLSGQAPAQDYPTRTVHIIAPYGPGGPADIFSRVLAQKLSDSLKQGFVIENRPGASTMIGSDAVAKAAPDGYTLLIISQTHAANESLVPNNPFQLMRDFAPVSPLYAGLRGFPPTLVQVGSDETLIDDAVRFVGAAGAADVAVTLQIWPHMIHAWPMWNAHLEAGRAALASAGAFMRRHVASGR